MTRIEKQTVLIVTASLLAIADVLIFLSSLGPQKHAHSAHSNPAEQIVAPLTCEQVFRIGRWSSRQYGGFRRTDLQSLAFWKNVSQLFAEKADPYKVLFLDSEVRRLKGAMQTGFPKWPENQRCELFEQWLNRHLPLARVRMEQHLRRNSLLGKAQTKTAGENPLEARLYRSLPFGRDENELKQRANDLVTKMLSAADPHVLTAYKSDRRKFVADSLRQLVFGEETNSNELLAKSVLGALDTHSTYFSPNEFEDFYYELAGGATGLGVKVRKVPQGLVIEKITKDSPAGRCKVLEPGDILTAVDEVSLVNMPLSVARRALRGPENTKARIQFQKGPDGPNKSVVLERKSFALEDAKITHKVITSKKRPDIGIAVIEVPSFYGRGGMEPLQEERSSSEDLQRILSELRDSAKKTPSAIVLDLRGNPGGFLEEAVSMASFFLGEKPVVGVVENGTHRRILKEKGNSLYQGPVVLLLDEGSASASEVLAGALKDHQRAVLVGSKHTYGKGSVQRLFHLNDDLPLLGENMTPVGGVIKLTTSIFYSPLGHSPANGGVSSHISLPNMSSGEEAEPVENVVPESSPFLDDQELEDLRNRQDSARRRIADLEKRSVERIKEWNGESNQNKEIAVGEAVEVAADYVAYDQKNTTRILK